MKNILVSNLSIMLSQNSSIVVWLMIMCFCSKDAVRKCEQNVEDHAEYKEKYGKAETCIRGIKEKYAQCVALTNSKDDLETKQTITQVCSSLSQSLML